MCLKRYINRLSLIQLTLKGMGILYIVPVVFLFLVLPFLTYLDFAKGYSPEQCYFSTYIMLQIFCPFFAVWWTLFGFREYVEGRIRELLLVYKKSLIVELFLVFVFYFLHICVLLGLYCIILNFNYFNYIFIFFVQTFAFFSISFSISIICLLYTSPSPRDLSSAASDVYKRQKYSNSFYYQCVLRNILHDCQY